MMEYLLHHLLEGSARRYPDRTAVVDRDRSVTYAELEARSNRLAHLLLDLGVARGDRVGLYLDKSLEALVGIYGVLKAGATYVPFDPKAPAARLAYIARNCDVRVLLSGTEKSGRWGELLAGGAPLEAVVVLNGESPTSPGESADVQLVDASALASRKDTPPSIGAIDLDLAYILYTSGSTGDPKGVMLSHLNAKTFVDWGVDRFALTPDDRLSNHAPLHFDLTIFDIFAAAAAGATMVIVPPETSVFPIEVRKFIDENEITVWYSVPSVLSMLTLRGGLRVGSFPRLRTLLFAGEVFPTKYLRRLMTLLPDVSFYNLYGPTETNVCTYYEVPPLPEDQSEPIPIGQAIDNVEVFAVTDEGRVARAGEVGELYVRGTTVMHGYWGDSERTARALLPNPYGGEVRDSVYRTGDLVRQDDDGNYRLMGRRDHQIKSRGYRIELGEIESALYAHPAVLECVVIAEPDEMITNRIKAYVVTRDSAGERELVKFCAGRIPQYMIPGEFEFREELPKTSTGKIDRQALAAGTVEAGAQRRPLASERS
jgi:amino acid adenylation domain-containing protein